MVYSFDPLGLLFRGYYRGLNRPSRFGALLADEEAEGRTWSLPGQGNERALVQVSAASAWEATVDPLVPSTAAGTQSYREVEGASEVQNEISRRELAGVRARPRAPRRRDTLALRRRDGRVETGTVWSTGRAEEVLGPLERDRVDTATRVPVAVAPNRGLLAVGPGLDAHRPRRAGPHHALAAESAPRSRTRSQAGHGPSTSSSSIARDCRSSARASGRQRNTGNAASAAGRSCISVSTAAA